MAGRLSGRADRAGVDGAVGYAVALIGPSASAAIISLGPVIAALLAIPILHEWPSLTDWIGIAVISAGVYLASGGPLPFTSASRPARRP